MSDDLIEKIASALDLAMVLDVKLGDLARAALSAIEKSGTHVVVPKEPTDEMFANASDSPGSRMACQHVWADMLSARPPLPEGENT